MVLCVFSSCIDTECLFNILEGFPDDWPQGQIYTDCQLYGLLAEHSKYQEEWIKC